MAEDTGDIVEQQRLASTWQAETTGPLVGPLLPSTELLGGFPESDPRHKKISASDQIRKTWYAVGLTLIQNLIKDFPEFRPMRGDGSCGFRALLYGFLTNLGRSGSVQLVKTAKQVLSTAEISFQSRGWDTFIYEDWLGQAASLYDVLEEYCLKLPPSSRTTAQVGELLDGPFNDEDTSIEILQFSRAVTSSYMVAHGEDFAPFVEDGGTVEEWCNANVDPASAEMEEASLLAAYRALVEETGMKMHVHALERSIGDTLHVSTYEPRESLVKELGDEKVRDLHLLYRPGHYDLLIEA